MPRLDPVTIATRPDKSKISEDIADPVKRVITSLVAWRPEGRPAPDGRSGRIADMCFQRARAFPARPRPVIMTGRRLCFVEASVDDSVMKEMQDELASREGTRTEFVELGRIRDFLLAMDEPADVRMGDPAPALFLLTFGRTRRPQSATGGGVKISDECRLLAPIFVGETITVETRLTGIERKEGRRGTGYTYGLEFDLSEREW